MRELKFRTWDEGNMSYGITDVSCDATAIMQYTGLKDKNGKEIYESDCVRFPVHDGATVIWNDIDACFEFQANKHYCEPHMDQECEVVGNVYENPELI